MADYTVDLSALATANPWTPSAPLKKGSTANLQLVNGSGAKSASGGSVSYGVHDVNYTLGSTQLRAEVDIGTVVFASDRVGPAIIARSGANAGAGYAALPDNYGYIYVYKVSAAGALTQIGYIGSITLAANDLIGLGYQQSTNTLTVYQNGTSKTTVTDSTYNADTTLGAGWLADPQNTNSQYVKRLLGTGVAATAAVISSPTPSGTIGTGTTATIGATTNQNTGTLYAILSTTQADVTGASAANIKAGQKAGGSAAAFSGNAAVSTTSPSISISGLTGNTLYYYAVVQNNSNGDSNILSTGSFTTANPAAALSSGTPSGTIGTQTTANIGATTTQNSGTVYAIVSTVQGDVTGASAANIKAGQKSGGSAAPFSGSATVTTTSPSVAISGLTAGTLYYYAIIQNNGNGDSNIINTGSFTTAAATSSFSIPLKSAAGVLLSGVTLRFWTRLTEDGAAIDGGSAGIPIICGSDGVFAISTLTIAKGAGFLYWSNPADPYKRHYIPYTFY